MRRVGWLRKVVLATSVAGFVLAISTSASHGTVRTGPVQVTVIPPDPPLGTPADYIAFAGATGFLHQYNDRAPYLWTTYATGATVPVPELANVGGIEPDGPDSIGTDQLTAGDVSVLDLTTMSLQQWPIPAGDHVLRILGNHVLVLTSSLATDVLTFAGGTSSETPVTGLPSGAHLLPATMTGDTSWAVATFGTSSTSGVAMIDLGTGQAVIIPGATPMNGPAILTSTSVALYHWPANQVSIYSRSGLADGTGTTPQIVTLPATSSGYHVAATATDVIAATGAAGTATGTSPVIAVPIAGGPVAQMVAQAQDGLVTETTGGSVLAVGGTGPADWSVWRISSDGTHQAAATPVLALNGAMVNAGLTISQGMVRHVESQPGMFGRPAQPVIFSHPLSATAGVGGDQKLTGALPCFQSAPCVRTADGGVYGTSYLTGSAGVRTTLLQGNDTRGTSIPSADAAIVDVSPDYAIVDGTSPSAQYLIAPGYYKIVRTRAVTGAGMWLDSQWSSDGKGQLLERTLPGLRAIASVSTGAACTATDVQVAQRWVYWSCGTSGPAGVYSKRTGRKLRVPAGRALLGDGYLVIADRAGASTVSLRLYAFDSGAIAKPVTLATIPAGPAPDSRNITWAVDKYDGDVAYVDAADAVHVIAP